MLFVDISEITLTKIKYTISIFFSYSRYTANNIQKVYFTYLLKVEFKCTCFHLILEHSKVYFEFT